MSSGGELNWLRKMALSQIPRILGFCDRDPSSPTFGCFDRYYWHYRILDFANLRFQEAAAYIALLYACDFPDNPYYRNSQIRRIVSGALAFWVSQQHLDGSADEVYPNERSFVATAFSGEAVLLASRLAEILLPPVALDRLGTWLTANRNPEVSNQEAGAIVVLRQLGEATGCDRFLRAAEQRLEQLIARQTPEGYFPEYGGYDYGYQSITLSMLCRYHEQTSDKRVADVVERGVAFVTAAQREDGSYDNTGTSRHTQYVYPYAFAYAACGDALRRLARGLEIGAIVNPSWMDDRFCIPLALDYLMASLTGEGHCLCAGQATSAGSSAIRGSKMSRNLPGQP